MASNIGRQYKHRYERAEELAIEGNFEGALSICFELRLKHDLGLWRRALVNLLIANIADAHLNPALFAQECLDLLDQYLVEGLPANAAFEGAKHSAEQRLLELRAELSGVEHAHEHENEGEQTQNGKTPVRKIDEEGAAKIAATSGGPERPDLDGEDGMSSDSGSLVTIYESAEDPEADAPDVPGAETRPVGFKIEGYLNEDYGESKLASEFTEAKA